MNPLISVDEIKKNSQNIILVDCRFDLLSPNKGKQDFETGHIPGSFFANLENLCHDNSLISDGRHPLPHKKKFIDLLKSFGANNESLIVSFDNSHNIFACRFWWMCKWIGHMNCGVLDGGINAWIEKGNQLVAGFFPKNLSGSISIRPTLTTEWKVEMIKSWVKSGCNGEICTLIDARSSKRFNGKEEPIDPKAGHIKGAINRPYMENLEENGKFKSPKKLRNDFDTLLKNKFPSSVVHTCGSGISACHNLVAMEVAGLPGSSLYVGSWSQWCYQGIET